MEEILKRLRDALSKAAGQYGKVTDEERNEWEAIIIEFDAALAAAHPDDLTYVRDPWTFEFAPDGDDPGVGNLTVRSSWGNPGFPLVQTTQDDVQRGEWDAFVRA